MALSFAAASAAPVNAAPLFVSPTAKVSSDVEQVQYRWRDWDDDDRFDRDDRRRLRRIIRRGDNFYLNGHRGFRYHRPGYRRYGEFWFPAAAFLAGALITGAINSPRVRTNSAHVQWCYDRYRSYRASDNTFQPYEGPRRQCYSPYD